MFSSFSEQSFYVIVHKQKVFLRVDKQQPLVRRSTSKIAAPWLEKYIPTNPDK